MINNIIFLLKKYTMTLVINLTTAVAGWSGSSSANTWHTFSTFPFIFAAYFRATNPNTGACLRFNLLFYNIAINPFNIFWERPNSFIISNKCL